MDAEALSAIKVSKSFPVDSTSLRRIWLGLVPKGERVTALEEISLAVPTGEFVGVLGRNGAGKSTLLRVLAGIYAPDRGTVEVSGELAGLFELGGMGNTQLTGREYAHRYLQIFGVPDAQRHELVEEIGEFSELQGYFDERVLTYSAGMSARLYFAVATALEHDVYLIDEVLSVGDEHFQVKSWSRLRDRVLAGASGVLVTHDWSAIIRLCRSACIISHGKKVMEGPADVSVARYLDLVVPTCEGFHLDIPDETVWSRDGISAIDFTLELTRERQIEVAVSIEFLELGQGWEPVVLSPFADLGRMLGRRQVKVVFDGVRLSPGRYSLALFLRETLDDQKQTLAVRSWTYGNGLGLVVEGAVPGGLIESPLRWVAEEN